MKIGMKWVGVVLFVMLSAAPVRAETTTNAWFYSKCSGRATGVTLGSSTRLAIEIKGLSAQHRVQLKLRYYPDGDAADSAQLAQESLWTNTAANDGKVRFDFDFDPPAPREGQPRLWIAQATWNDLQLPAIRGTATSRIYAALAGEEQLFVLNGPALCRWQMDPVLFHPYRRNQAAYSVTLEQEVDLNWLAPDHGVELSFMGPAGPAKPGWFFPQWESVYGDASRKVKQSWQIPMNAGGFLATQLKFTRYPVKEFTQQKVNGCRAWVVGRAGVLDVGAKETDFFVVPPEFATEDEKAIQLIRDAYPMLNSCDGSLPKAALDARVWMSSEDYPLYFYAR